MVEVCLIAAYVLMALTDILRARDVNRLSKRVAELENEADFWHGYAHKTRADLFAAERTLENVKKIANVASARLMITEDQLK